METEAYRKELAFLVNTVQAEKHLALLLRCLRPSCATIVRQKYCVPGEKTKIALSPWWFYAQNNKILAILLVDKPRFPKKIFYP